jgi:hypothetical protein
MGSLINEYKNASTAKWSFTATCCSFNVMSRGFEISGEERTVILTTVCSLRWWQTSIITERAEKRAPSLEKILKCLEEKTRDSVIDAVKTATQKVAIIGV